MSLTLRPYQTDLVNRVRATYAAGTRSVVMQLGTGGGKTATASALIASATARGRRTIFLAHLDALIGDTYARLEAAGIRAGFVQGDRPTDPEAPVQVASLQTLHVRGERPPADLVILDECHRAMSASVRGILDAYPKAWLLGLTATPQRGDGRPLGDVFRELVCGPSNTWLTAAGYLVPYDLLGPRAFVEGALVGDPVDVYQRRTPGKRAIVFAANVAHAHDLAARFTAAGHPAGCMVGDTPRDERERLREGLDTGSVRVLVGVGVFVEGFDAPPIETVILARPFTVTGSYLQAIGRGLRPSASTGKARCTVLDLRGSVHLHGLPDDDRVWSLEGRAVRRADVATPLRRCPACLAIFRPAARCPRCGARAASAPVLPKVLNRAEKLERWNALPPAERDRRYLARLEHLARNRLRMRSDVAATWARRQFAKRFRREPVAA